MIQTFFLRCCVLIVALWILVLSMDAADSGITNNSSCEQFLRNFYRSIPQLSDDHAWYMNYTVVMAERDGGTTRSITTEVTMSTERMKMISNEMEMYQDEKYSVTVVPAEKKIYLADKQENGSTQKMLEMMAMLRDTLLFSRCDIESCKDVRSSDGLMLKEIVLVFKSKIKNMISKRYPVERILLQFDQKTKKPYSFTTLFTAAYPLKSLTAIFHKIDYQISKDQLSFRAGEKYLTSGQKLRPAYNSYSIIDVRKKK
jgi:hypothetical protein